MSSSVLTDNSLGLSGGVFSETPAGDTAVSVRGLSKSYSIAKNAVQHSTVGEMLMHKLKNPIQKAEKETFWALSDVSFDVQKGDVVGVIGRNGAGKSTLLKILSRITEPTKGKINLYGRVGSLLEVGTGFHPELTGRENIFLNGAILGMSKGEITQQFDAIVDFSGVAKFLDTPVKRYSSGMYVRLAFAVAAHLNPEILIIDEVLAVGDAEFQRKCMGKMQDVADSGRTVLFVSHNMGAISDLCPKAILMGGGHLLDYGPTDRIIAGYMGDTKLNHLEVEIDPSTKHGAEAMFTACRVTDLQGNILKAIDVNERFLIAFDVLAHKDLTNIEVSLRVGDASGHPLFTTNVSDANKKLIALVSGLNKFSVEIPSHFLVPGNYTIALGLHTPNVKIFHAEDHLLSFEIEETGSDMWKYSGNNYGSILVRFPWNHDA